MNIRPGFTFDEQELIRQQEILTVLGFYYGSIDGRWGELSIQAMSKFEKDTRFKPGVPNNGMPLSNYQTRGRVPSVLEIKDGMLYTPLLEDLWKKAEPKAEQVSVSSADVAATDTPTVAKAKGK